MRWVFPPLSFFSIFYFLLLATVPVLSDELLDQEHQHYSQQLNRIREALGKKEDKKAETASLVSDALRSEKWIFEEPKAAETEERHLTKRISKEFLDLDLPVLIHPTPPRSILTEKTTSFSRLLVNYSTQQILVTVSVPYFQDSGMRKAKNEATFLSILLLQDGIMEVVVDGAHTISESVSEHILEPGGLMEKFISTHGLTKENLSVDINRLAAGGGLATTHITIPFPLHIGGTLFLEVAKKSYPPYSPVSIKKPSRKHPYTGLILDARPFKIKPFRDLVLISDQNMSLFIPDQRRSSQSVPFGWAGWEDGLSPAEMRKRVGGNPLVIRPAGIINHHIIVLTQVDSEKVFRSFQTTKLLSSGHISILVPPMTPAAALSSSVSIKGGSR
jgi:hypothetical protein